MDAQLVLEDGRVFRGRGYGAALEGGGEVVFNTAMTGYQEICTDPSYAGQIVCLTAAQIGNYGTSPEDDEAARPYVEGLIVREFSAVASNWRSREACQAYLERHRIPVLAEIDTRALVRHLREHGAQRGVIGSANAAALQARAQALPSMQGADLAKVVSTPAAYAWPGGAEGPRVVAYDFGMKRNILRQLAAHGCRVQVVPAQTPAAEVLALRPDGVF
ncbi:MAG: carbamoyl phosphate synthase small subunit, partial [Terriglobales bacterium]